jgi:hypothetical protein
MKHPATIVLSYVGCDFHAKSHAGAHRSLAVVNGTSVNASARYRCAELGECWGGEIDVLAFIHETHLNESEIFAASPFFAF